MFNQHDDILTIKELCSLLKIGKNTAYDLIHSGELKCVWVKHQIRIPKAYLIEFLEKEQHVHSVGVDSTDDIVVRKE